MEDLSVSQGVFIGLIGKGRDDLLLRPAQLHLRQPDQHEPVGPGQRGLGHRTGPQPITEHHVDLGRPQRQLRAQVEPGQQGDDDEKPMHDDYYFFRPSEKLPDEGSVNVRLTFSVNRPFGPSLSRVEVGVSEVGTASCIRTIRGERKQHWRTYTRGVPPRSIEFHLAGQRVFPWVGVRASQYKRFDQKRKKIIRLFSTVSNLLLRFLEGTLSRSEVIGPL